MVYYFTNLCPLLVDFKDYVAKEFVRNREWAIDQVKFFGHNFFLIVFANEFHRDKFLAEAPGTWIGNLCIQLPTNWLLMVWEIITSPLSR